MLTGAFGAILLSSPGSYTVGASGAVFGLMGAGVVFLRARGVDPWHPASGRRSSSTSPFPFLFPGLNVSIGGHMGGLLGGLLAGWIVTRWPSGARRRCCPCSPAPRSALVALVATYYEARDKVGLL